MRRTFYHSSDGSGLPYEFNKRKQTQENNLYSKKTQRKDDDEDLIIEDNTIYEIDRDCYERLWRQRRKK